ncbi:hypothetical protein O0550_00290 [Brevibacillus halotolerans]|uniref:hypothetical protein n=1 Tax=Brevibacillus TaxID=55080 RepID=UPI00215B94CC|nr:MULTISPECIES: hypothetical protein [Brevibacillus]MCR8961648.1 hypothetical protein [Brevibacillus laterosporus]MCZ0833803.1 hypothetical protein [Brevibacillus halotolerans]
MPNVQNGDAMTAIMSFVTKVLTEPAPNGMPNVNERDVTFVSFPSAGIPATNNIFDTTDQAIFNFSRLVNVALPSSGRYRTSGNITWSVYDRVMSSHALPFSDLSPEEQTRLQQARDFLYQPDGSYTPAHKAYYKYKTDYQAAHDAYAQAALKAGSAPTPEEREEWRLKLDGLVQAVNDAFEEWGAGGHRGQVQEARATIASLTGRGPQQYFNHLGTVFNETKKHDRSTNTDYWPTRYIPEDILDPTVSWPKYTLKHGEINFYASQSSTSFGGGAGLDFGLFSFGAETTWSENHERSQCETSNLEIEFEMIQLPLIRPWWDPLIFKNRGWKWAPGVSPDLISDGGRPPQGLMPIYATDLILARNLKITMDMTSAISTAVREKLSVSGSVGFGPFSLRGNYATDDANQTFNFTETGNGIEVSGAQIIGFLGEVLPKSPDPDPDLNWE